MSNKAIFDIITNAFQAHMCKKLNRSKKFLKSVSSDPWNNHDAKLSQNVNQMQETADGNCNR